MDVHEAKTWLTKEGCVRCKSLENNLLFDAMPWENDTVIIRQAISGPVEFYVVSLDVFAERFGAIGD